MAIEVILPKVDMDMSTGTISKWHVKDGDTVAKGAAIFEIETDKAAMEIESPGAGIIKIGDAKEGTAVPIGTIVAMIYVQGETPVAFAGAASAAPAASTPAPAASPSPAAPAAAAPAGTSTGSAPRATPLARRLARQAGLALAKISGSGPRGRITAADIQKSASAKPAATSTAALASGMDATAVKALYEPGSYDLKPLDGMRRTIAQRLTQSKQTVPHFYLQATCTIDMLMAARERMNNQAPKGPDKSPLWKLSINDFIIKAMALALQKVPEANVTFSDDGLLFHRTSDVGVAVAVEGGLFTPIVRRAETKSLSQISAEVKDLAGKAKARKLQPGDYQGGTAAISNLGMYGVESFTAIINPPQATILAVGAAVERFVPVNKQPALVTQMTVTLSCDHRAVDGAVGAQLLATFKMLIEDPAMMLV